ncbi:MAG: hypothetical protein IRY99_04190 [Isosphaeraceae bacterium]|nr:hypothetical protein [Isosphaeraceae bacterium]
MATSPAPSKSAFIEEQLRRNSHATEKEINQAWKEAGYEGSISGTLVYRIKDRLGLTGKHRSSGRRPRMKTAARREPAAEPSREAAPATEPMARGKGQGRVLDELEADLDNLIFRLKGLGGLEEVEEALRRARRLLVRSHRE